LFIKENHYNKLMRIIIFIIGVISMFGFFKKNNISSELREKLNSNDSIIIDVREENEVVEGHIEKAKWLPLSELKENSENSIENLKTQFPNKTFYLYCRSGNRSGIATDIFTDKGLKAQNIGAFDDLSKILATKKGQMDR